MDLSQINFLAVLVAAILSFGIGALWYSPVLFGNAWMKLVGKTEEQIKSQNMVKIFGTAFILAVIISFNLAAFLGAESNLQLGMFYGGLAGIGWVSCSIGIVYLFEGKPLKLFFIDAGYQIVTYIIMGGIIGVWK